MKKIFYITIISFATLFASCDYVANPYPAKNTNISDTATCANATFPAVTTHIKNILVEDYTAHTCPNCPRAARAINSLETTYHGQIIPLAVHCGSLAAPSPGYSGSPATAFTTDYRTTVGTTLDNFFGASAYGLPEGMFNRKYYNATTFSHLLLYTNFPSTAASLVNDTCKVDLQLNINYDASSRKICCAVRDSFLMAVSGTYKLCAFITQDSIIDWQVDIDATPNNIQYYVFNHVLRDAITPTGAWGEPLISNGASAGTKQIRHFAYTIPAAYKNINCIPKNCNIVAFIYNTATYEVIQSAMASVIP